MFVRLISLQFDGPTLAGNTRKKLLSVLFELYRKIYILTFAVFTNEIYGKLMLIIVFIFD